MHIFQATTMRNEMLTERVFEVVLEYASSEDFSFKPGQFVMVHVDDEIRPPIRRAYSIVSPPSELGVVRLWVEYAENCKGPEFLRALKPGQHVDISGPYGNFCLRETDRPIVLIATGTGVAPFYSMVADALEREDSRPIHLFFGVRHQEDLFGMHDMQQWADRYENFTLTPTLTRPSDHWEGSKGRVTTVVPEVLQNPKDCSFYICGAPQMVTDMQQVLIELGCDRGHIHTEKY